MPTPKIVGTEIKNLDLLEILPPDEGEINQYYGRIGSGKTYGATEDIIEELKTGKIIYANWKINWQGYDERESKWLLFLGILGLKKDFFYFPKENLHFFEVKDSFTDDISKLTDCKIYLDEGHIAFDSYEMARMKIEKRTAVLHTRHFDRTIVVISQRPTAIHVTLRANVNRFYKFEKISDYKLLGHHFLTMMKTEFQDVTDGDVPDETRKKDEEPPFKETEEYEFAISQKTYSGNKKIFEMYDTKYKRDGMPTSQPNYAQLFHLTWKERWNKLKG